MKKISLNVDGLLDAINTYIRKADEEQEEGLAAEGYVAVGAAVAAMNKIEDAISEILNENTDELLKRLEKSPTIDHFIKEIWPGMQSEKELRDALEKILHDQFQSLMGECVQQFLIDADEALAVDGRITKPAQDFIESWSSQLADLMHLNTNKQIEKILLESQEKAMSIEQVADAIADSGIRAPGWRARRVAQTEVLRVESYAQLEYMRQDPSVEEKEWVHTGSHKNKPRDNHMAVNGQRVPVEEPFELKGADGIVYHPMLPRDIRLPASESINCHCRMQEIRSEKIMGMSVEERRALREKYMDEVDAEWEAAHAADRVDMIKSMKREDQIKYFGGKDGGRQRMALIDSGVISTDKELEKLYKTGGKGRRQRKSLQELAEDGIFTVSNSTLNHSTVGEFTSTGRLAKGGHSQSCIDILEASGKEYVIIKTYPNGVRVGNVPCHKMTTKNGITENMTNASGHPGKKNADIGQAWFPESWSDDDIRNAGTYVANRGLGTGNTKFGEYKGVRVGIFMDADGNPATIFPDNMKQPTPNGGIEGARD